MHTTPARPRFFIGWTVVIAAALSAFTQVTFFNPVLGVFLPEFERDFGWSRTEISLAATLGTLGAALAAPFFGPMIDRYGGKPFVAVGGAIMAIGLVALANMQTEWQFFIIYAIGRSMATGILSVAATVTVSKWFIRRRGFAVAMTTIGVRVGFATMPIGVQLIIDQSDWRVACYVLAALVGIFGIAPALRWMHKQPEDLGLRPDGEAPAPRSPIGANAPVPVVEENWNAKDAIRTRAFWLLTFAISLQTFAGGAVNLHQIPYMVGRGIDENAAALLLSLYAVFAGIGGLMEGVLDHRLGARITFILGLLGSSAGMVVLMFTSSFEIGLVFAASYGLAFGLMITSQQVVFADFFGREALGAIRGASLPMFLAFQAAGPIFGGFIYDQTGSYLVAFIVFTAGYVAAAVAVFATHRPKMKGPAADGATPPPEPVAVSRGE